LIAAAAPLPATVARILASACAILAKVAPSPWQMVAFDSVPWTFRCSHAPRLFSLALPYAAAALTIAASHVNGLGVAVGVGVATIVVGVGVSTGSG
jgi:hypothetical protein